MRLRRAKCATAIVRAVELFLLSGHQDARDLSKTIRTKPVVLLST